MASSIQASTRVDTLDGHFSWWTVVGTITEDGRGRERTGDERARFFKRRGSEMLTRPWAWLRGA